MDADVYQLVIDQSKNNIFKKYLDFLHGLGELTEEENVLFNGIGREFIQLIETTNMTKVYKMPVLMAFYNDGNMRMAVTEEELLYCWKNFFGNGTNWKDLDKNITYEKYKVISDKEHVKKIMQMPVHFLQESGKGFFVKKDGYALALREELGLVIDNPAQLKSISVEQLLTVFLDALKPFSKMMADLLHTYEAAGARSNHNNIRMEFDFDGVPARFGLDAFRSTVSTIKERTETRTRLLDPWRFLKYLEGFDNRKMPCPESRVCP